MNSNQKRIKRPAGVLLSEIPGLTSALAEAQARQHRTREDAMLNLRHDICGFAVRTMTVTDYVLLERVNSPFTNRREPSLEQLAFFLWLMSPQFVLWNEGYGWRKFFSWFRPLAVFIHARKVRKAFGLNMPATSEPAVVAVFEYIDKMFFDSPPAVRGGIESALGYLASWFDAVQSEYHFPSADVWEMGLPELFQRLNAIRQRYNPSAPSFNKGTDNVKLYILRGLRANEFTLEQLKAGQVKLPENFSSN